MLQVFKKIFIVENYCFEKYVDLTQLKKVNESYNYDFLPPKDDLWYVNDCQNRCQKNKQCAWWTLDMQKVEGQPQAFIQPICNLMEASDNKKKMPNSKDGSFSLY